LEIMKYAYGLLLQMVQNVSILENGLFCHNAVDVLEVLE